MKKITVLFIVFVFAALSVTVGADYTISVNGTESYDSYTALDASGNNLTDNPYFTTNLLVSENSQFKYCGPIGSKYRTIGGNIGTGQLDGVLTFSQTGVINNQPWVITSSAGIVTNFSCEIYCAYNGQVTVAPTEIGLVLYSASTGNTVYYPVGTSSDLVAVTPWASSGYNNIGYWQLSKTLTLTADYDYSFKGWYFNWSDQQAANDYLFHNLYSTTFDVSTVPPEPTPEEKLAQNVDDIAQVITGSVDTSGMTSGTNDIVSGVNSTLPTSSIDIPYASDTLSSLTEFTNIAAGEVQGFFAPFFSATMPVTIAGVTFNPFLLWCTIGILIFLVGYMIKVFTRGDHEQ